MVSQEIGIRQRELAGARRPWLSVVIPACNEEGLIARAVLRARTAPGVEVIVADGGSGDRTARVATSCGAVVVHSERGRGVQMNAGAGAARGEVLLFLHADTVLPRRYERLARQALAQRSVVAGAFRLRVDGGGGSMRVVEAFANLRSRVLKMPYGDQVLFLKKDVFDRVGGFPQIAVMEDYELVRRLRRVGKIQICPVAVTTSYRGWQGRGVWATTVLHQLMVARYHLGVPPRRLAGWRDSIVFGGASRAVTTTTTAVEAAGTGFTECGVNR